jgi:hypothetical protein
MVGDAAPTLPDTGNAPSKAPPSNRMWNLIWLSKRCLSCFATLFFLLAIAIILIYVDSLKRSGLVSQTYQNRYTWKYGPTAGAIESLIDRPQIH